MSKQNFEVHRVEGGGDVYVDGAVAVDSYVFSNYPSITLVDGKKQVTQYPVWQDTILLADGTILTLHDSKIIKVEKKQGMSTQKFITAKTDKGIEITCDGETFIKGADVYTMTDGNKTPVSDGEHKLENGETLKVEAGKITDIVAADASEDEADKVIQSAVKPLFDKMKVDFESALKTQKESYEAEIKEIKTKLSNMPGSPPATGKTDEPAKTLSRSKALEVKLGILKKKNEEITKSTTDK